MKQLRLVVNENISVKNQNRKRNKRNRNKVSNTQTMATSVPMEIAYTVKQTSRPNFHVERACEIIGQISISPTDSTGKSVKFMMNPLTMVGTRLQNLAKNYQKYRFKRISMKLQSSTTTSTNGLYVVGYNSNPDFEYAPATAVQAAFSLPGAQSANVWRTTDTMAKIEDKGKWYNVDADSDELMQTTQGMFVFVVQSPPTTTAPITFPVLLDYEIEFSGSAVNDLLQSTPFLWPAGNFNFAGGVFTFTQTAGEPAPPNLPANTVYVINPEWPVSPGDVEADIGVVLKTTNSFVFYRSLDDYNSGSALGITTSFTVMRTLFQQAKN